jgi:putative two-component system response regulator
MNDEVKDAIQELDLAYGQAQCLARDFQDTVLRLRESRRQLETAYIDTLHRLSLAVEYKDEETGAHVVRLSRYSELMGRQMGMDPERTALLLHASPMHDVGKIGIPDAILLKPGRLTEEEFEIMKRHTVIGASLLENSPSEVIQLGRTIALTHHERWNGSGYPRGLAGEDIPLEGRIVALADVFDALTSQRPYKPAYSNEVALDIIKKESGSHFDPAVVECFLDVYGKVEAAQAEVNAQEGKNLEDFLCNAWDMQCLRATSDTNGDS